MENLITIENAHLIYRNFSGKEGQYNKAGIRSFNLVIDDPDIAQKMIDDGWNIRPMRKKNDDDPNEPPHWKLAVAVRYDFMPPEIIMLTNTGKKVRLDESMIDMLDYANILNADLTIRARLWSTPTGSGIKAYLKKMYVQIEEDPLDAKYADFE